MADEKKKDGEGESETKPEGVTREEMRTVMSGMLKDALKGALGKVKDDLTATVKTELESVMQPLKEQFAKDAEARTAAEKMAADKKAADAAVAQGQSGQKPAEINIADSPEFKALQEQIKAQQAQLEAQRKKTEQAEARGEAERQERRKASFRTSVSEELTKLGIPAERHKQARAYLEAEGLIGYADGGKGDAMVFRQDADTEVAITDGLKAWAKTPEAKLYLPAQQPGGPNQGGGSGRGPGANGGVEPINDLLGQMLVASAQGGLNSGL